MDKDVRSTEEHAVKCKTIAHIEYEKKTWENNEPSTTKPWKRLF